MAFHALCYALLARNKNELVSVLTDPEKEDMAVCFPAYSRFHLGGEVYVRSEREEITLKQGAIEMCFPLIRLFGHKTVELLKDTKSSYWEIYQPCKDNELAAVQKDCNIVVVTQISFLMKKSNKSEFKLLSVILFVDK